jgi:hypothetical protein
MALVYVPLLVIALMGASPPFLAFGWDAWERLRAVYVPQDEIDRLAAECVARFGADAAAEIEIQMDRAQRRGEIGEYWVLRRVLTAIIGGERKLSMTPP